MPALSKEALRNTAYIDSLRRVDAFLHVLRFFEDETVMHTEGSLNAERDWELAEFEIYGEGFVTRTSYTSPILDFGKPVSWSKIRWAGEKPEGTEVFLRTRTGNSPQPNFFWRVGSTGDFEQVTKLLDLDRIAIADANLSGDWQCRTIKLGGLAALVIYDWFDCTISGNEWRLEKTSGSQRTQGSFYTLGAQQLAYLGSYHVAGDPVPHYGNGPETDQVGYAFMSAADHWWIEFPAPYRESVMDILEFRRQ